MNLLPLLVAFFAFKPSFAEPTRVPPPQANGARFQIFFGPFARADVFLVDTQTGRVWMNVVDPEKRNLFQEVPVEKEDNQEFQDYLTRIETARRTEQGKREYSEADEDILMKFTDVLLTHDITKLNDGIKNSYYRRATGIKLDDDEVGNLFYNFKYGFLKPSPKASAVGSNKKP